MKINNECRELQAVIMQWRRSIYRDIGSGSFWGTLRVRPTRAEAQRQVRDWLLYCNGLRPHLKLQMKSPNEYYAQLLTASQLVFSVGFKIPVSAPSSNLFVGCLIRINVLVIQGPGRLGYLTSQAVIHIAAALFTRQIANMAGQIFRETPAVPKTLAAN